MNTENKYPELIIEFSTMTGWEDETRKDPIISGDGMILVPQGHPFYLIDPDDIEIDFKGFIEWDSEIINKRTIKQAPYPESYLGYYAMFFRFDNFPAKKYTKQDLQDMFEDFANKLRNYKFD